MICGHTGNDGLGSTMNCNLIKRQPYCIQPKQSFPYRYKNKVRYNNISTKHLLKSGSTLFKDKGELSPKIPQIMCHGSWKRITLTRL